MWFSQGIKELLRLNRAGDVDPQLRQRILGAVLRVTTAMMVLGFALWGDLTNASPLQRGFQLGAIAALALIWLFWKRKQVDLAAWVLVLEFWVLITLAVIIEGGRSSYWLVPQVLLVVFTRFIINGRAAIMLALMTVSLDLAIFSFRLDRYLPSALMQLTSTNEWSPIVLSFLSVLFILYLSDRVLHETVQDARITEGRYRSLFDRTNDAVFLISLDLRYLEVNQKAADLLGYSVNELVGKPLAEVIAPEEIEAMYENFERVKREGMIPVFERTIVRKDGSRRIVEVNVAQVTDQVGRPRYHQSVMRDVTERKRLETELKISLEEMETLAMQDSLTGLLNRRAITEHAEAEWHRAEREKRSVCLMLIDLDNLKDVNDHHGHLMGDKMILELAKVIRESRRHYDWAGRWGGDEFMLVLPGANLPEAQEVAERLRNEFATSELVLSLDEKIRSIVSLGIACYSGRPGEKMQLSELIAQADQALYRAKQEGKNRVEIYRDKEVKEKQ